MPEDAPPRGRDPLIFVDRYQFLSSEFEVRTDSERVRSSVASMAQRAQQAIPIASRHTLAAVWAGEQFSIEDDGAAGDFELTAFYAAQNLVSRMHRRALANLRDEVRLRAAIGARQGRAFLLAGPKGSGKTTLALRLLFDGCDMAGDDLVLLGGGTAVAFPWRFLVPESSIDLLPQVQARQKRASLGPLPAHESRFAVAPPDFGRPWQIAPAEVSTIFFLEPDFGLPTRVVRSAKIEMVRHLLPLCTPPPSARRDWIADLSRLVDGAETFTVRLGDLDSAVLEITSMLR